MYTFVYLFAAWTVKEVDCAPDPPVDKYPGLQLFIKPIHKLMYLPGLLSTDTPQLPTCQRICARVCVCVCVCVYKAGIYSKHLEPKTSMIECFTHCMCMWLKYSVLYNLVWVNTIFPRTSMLILFGTQGIFLSVSLVKSLRQSPHLEREPHNKIITLISTLLHQNIYL